MDSIERAIRNALTKAQAQTPKQRQAVYVSVWAAHERALTGQAHNLTDEAKDLRRGRLKEIFHQLENELQSPSTSQPVNEEEHQQEQVNLHVARDYASDYVPGFDAVPEGFSAQSDYPQPSPENTYIEGAEKTAKSRAADKKARKLEQKAKRPPFWRRAIVPVTFLVAFLIIGFSFYSSFNGFSGSFVSSNGESNFAPVRKGEQDENHNWITIFDPADASRLTTKGRAIAELKNEGNSRFLRVISPGASDTIRIEVGEGVLAQLAGKRATFDILARGDTLDKAQMSVVCDFGNLGDCGRRRFDVGIEAADYLFDVDFSNMKQAKTTGWLEIASDISGQGAAIEILNIRVFAE